jgi:hypothetical protein
VGVSLPPTAKQLVGVPHDTAESALAEPPTGSGAIDQFVPFHRSINVLPPPPTARQEVVLGHATPVRNDSGVYGLVAIDQAEPFQCSMRGLVVVPIDPTAKQLVALAHVTDERSPGDAVGVGRIDQTEPVSRSASAEPFVLS